MTLIIDNFFSEEELMEFNKSFEEAGEETIDNNQSHADLGRKAIQMKVMQIPKKANEIAGEGLTLKGINIVEYGSEFGKPNLPPHFDGDSTDLIINVQLKSNTSWGVGVDKEVFYIEDNTAVIFNPNKHIHWRPRKEFKPGEFVRMAFLRYFNMDNPSDYSHLRYSIDHEIFSEINDLLDIQE